MMNTYTAVRDRLLQLCGQKNMSLHRLATESAVPPSTVKNILYGKSTIRRLPRPDAGLLW